MGFNRSVGYEPETCFRKTMKRCAALLLIGVLAGCVGQMRSARTEDMQRDIQQKIRAIRTIQAIVTGQYILTDGAIPNRTWWFTTIWVRTPSGWRMVHDHSS